MDHALNESLNLESTIGVDFEHSEDAEVSQGGISLDTGAHNDSIQMEFEHIEEQPTLMDTDNEEIIVSDFMGEQFTLQEYPSQEDQMATITAINSKSEPENLLGEESESMLDLQFETQPMSVALTSDVINTSDVQVQPKFIKLQSAPLRPVTGKKEIVLLSSALPRQVAIAPKPTKVEVAKKMVGLGKQFAIAPRPVSLVGNKSISLVKKLGPSTTAPTKGNAVLTQIGKQLLMMGGSGQKIKLVPAGGGNAGQQAQIMTQNAAGGKSVLTKVVLQGSSGVTSVTSGSPAVSRIAGAGGTRLVAVTPKTVPISIAGSKVLLTSPSKRPLKVAQKPQVLSKLLPVPTSQGNTTKKVVISANSNQNVILRTTAPGAVTKSGQVTKTGQKTQLHQINVPGKGIQYIRLVTNSNAGAAGTGTTVSAGAVTAGAKGVSAGAKSVSATPKTFVFADNKGNLIQMPADKLGGHQPPPLVVTSSALQRITSGATVVSSKPQQKLVRIAPISSKTAQAVMSRGQSLLATRVSESGGERDHVVPMPATVTAGAGAAAAVTARDRDLPRLDDGDRGHAVSHPEIHVRAQQPEETDSKTALRALIADAVGEDSQGSEDDRANSLDDPLDFHRSQPFAQMDDSNSNDAEHPLIVIPSFLKERPLQHMQPEQLTYIPKHLNSRDDNGRQMKSIVDVEVEPYNPYMSPDSPPDPEAGDEMGGLRARKACNCTKSQCLKLYCDCFANGEFCNRCNCTNCHNNLDNEELRQKAIRGCLDRNPNAFRPKIGKSKIGGPEMIRRHNKGCNCKRSGCLKNYCECYEARIACSAICKCVGCRNVEETLERGRRHTHAHAHTHPHPHTPAHAHAQAALRAPVAHDIPLKQPCSFMTSEVIEAVCQCLLAAAVDNGDANNTQPVDPPAVRDPMRDVIEEFARCLQDIISASHQAQPMQLLDETQT